MRLGYTRERGAVARKKRKKAFRAVSAVKEMARERIGSPRPEQVVVSRKKKASIFEKHKRTLADLLQEHD
jgi:hypothetical protein